jgi:hypothetical protein
MTRRVEEIRPLSFAFAVSETQDLDSAAAPTSILNKVGLHAIRIDPLKLHSLTTDYANNEVAERAFVVVHSRKSQNRSNKTAKRKLLDPFVVRLNGAFCRIRCRRESVTTTGVEGCSKQIGATSEYR